MAKLKDLDHWGADGSVYHMQPEVAPGPQTVNEPTVNSISLSDHDSGFDAVTELAVVASRYGVYFN